MITTKMFESARDYSRSEVRKILEGHHCRPIGNGLRSHVGPGLVWYIGEKRESDGTYAAQSVPVFVRPTEEEIAVQEEQDMVGVLCA